MNRHGQAFLWIRHAANDENELKERIGGLMGELTYPTGYEWGYSFWEMEGDRAEKNFAMNIVLALIMGGLQWVPVDQMFPDCLKLCAW